MLGFCLCPRCVPGGAGNKKSGFEEAALLMGWNMGLEPTTLGTTNRCSNQLS